MNKLKNFKIGEVTKSRETFIMLFLILVLVLTFFPLLTTFNDILTRIVINLKGYYIIREVIVPIEIKMVAVLLLALGQDIVVTKEYIIIGNNSPLVAEIIWNCIGWQSILFFIITAFIGFQGNKYTNLSKLKAFIIGVFGTFLINIFRIAVVVLATHYLGRLTAEIIHTYASLLVQIAWLFFFWWFSYKFVLEEKNIK